MPGAGGGILSEGKMGSLNSKKLARLKRKRRIRKKLNGTPNRPRLCVFRSSRHIYAQVIDDINGRTIVAASSLEDAVTATSGKKDKIAKAAQVGQLIGERALQKGVSEIVFDRNGFLYHGRVKAVSEGARKAGLVF